MEDRICSVILKKISGAVVWYNPKEEDVFNIKSYINYIDKLYVFDNSSKDNSNKLLLVEEYKDKIEYICFYENKGIAESLNYCAKLSREKGYTWLLTMDQDSSFQEESFKNFYKYLSEDKVGIVGPIYRYKDKKNFHLEETKYVDRLITSGNLINLEIHKELSGFREKLFIDEVDHEYCYRVNKKYRLKQVKDVILNHSLGKVCVKKIIGLNISYTEHSPFRKYYIWRNRLYVMNNYPKIRKEYFFYLVKDLIKILVFEKQKIEKIKRIIKGIKELNNIK